MPDDGFAGSSLVVTGGAGFIGSDLTGGLGWRGGKAKGIPGLAPGRP